MTEEQVKEIIASYLAENLDGLVSALMEADTDKPLTYANVVTMIASYVEEFVGESELVVTQGNVEEWIQQYNEANTDWYKNLVGGYVTENFVHRTDDDINSLIDARLEELGLI